MAQSLDPTATLRHLGFIVDGNRRWAKERGLPTIEGHRRGEARLKEVIQKLQTTEVEFVTFYVFSTENWQRSPEEVRYLMRLVSESLTRLGKTAAKQNLRIAILGRAEPVEPELWQKLLAIEQSTQDNTGLTVAFCFNYGGHWEIADAASRAVAAGETEFTPEILRGYLYHPEIPDLDLIVRTSGEERLSGFMLWRAAYAELLFFDKFFPDFVAADCDTIIKEFHARSRRFGK